ncbi:MAG: cache domain-containing protein [Candidatus Levybacteria bacterium]|nr:cache domain-containing protein [Candidatus Levybacteria bacterium]
MWLQFFLENFHFAINLAAALIFFAVFWLYFDAWSERRRLKEVARWLGFLFLAISFVISAIHIESTILTSPILSEKLSLTLLGFVRILGYFFLIISLVIEPLLPKPHTRTKKTDSVVLPLTLFSGVFSVQLFFPILAVVTGFLYLRRSTVGLEDHIKPVSLSFFILSISELLSATTLFQNTSNAALFNLVAPFGIVWVVQHLVLLAVTIVLGKWAFGYLLKRFQSQLFILFSSCILVIFLLTTVSFTALLVKQLENDTLSHLTSDVKVLGLVVESKKGEVTSDAQAFAQNEQVIQLVNDRSLSQLFEISESYLLAKKESFLVITDANGQVLVRGEDKEHSKDSLSDDSLIKKALLGELAASIISKDGVISPQISIRGAAPIKSDGGVIGAVMTGVSVDDAFVDNMKKTTGLEASMYGGNHISATTLLAADGKTRLTGIAEENKSVKATVLDKGEALSTGVSFANVSYFASYFPLKDIDDNPVGMLFVGSRQVGVLAAAAKSIELTFIIAAFLLVFSIVPALLVSKYIARQLE